MRLAPADGSRRCERRGCSNTFIPHPRAPKTGPKRRRFCCHTCATKASYHARGIYKPKAYGVCKNGHERTPTNVYENARGHKRCLICKRKYQREWIKAKRQEAVC